MVGGNCMYWCVCACVYVRACMRVCVCVFEGSDAHQHSHYNQT